MTKLLLSVTAILAASFLPQAKADNFTFGLGGPGVSGTVTLTYGTATDARYPQGLEVTGINGSFSDSNNGLDIVNASIAGIVPLNRAMPEPTNLLAPNDFSHFTVTSGLQHGFISYDDLLYPGGSPQTASDYPFAGGFLDIYGVLFSLGNGDVVNLWSNGSFIGSPLDYGVAVANADTSLDYVSGGVQVTPEPSSLLLFGTGLLAILVWLRLGTADQRRLH